MTNELNDETADAQVEQVDRDAAAANTATVEYANLVRRGACDMSVLVQAFARHRIAALSDRAAEREGEVQVSALEVQVATLTTALTKAEAQRDAAWEALRPFAAVADEWDRWQAKGSTSSQRMIQLSYGRRAIGLPEYQAARAALPAERESDNEAVKDCLTTDHNAHVRDIAGDAK